MTGAIVIGDEVEMGQTLQFHVRDADSADKDLRRILEQEAAALAGQRPAGALLFTCNGRGSRMFPEPDHDGRSTLKWPHCSTLIWPHRGPVAAGW